MPGEESGGYIDDVLGDTPPAEAPQGEQTEPVTPPEPEQPKTETPPEQPKTETEPEVKKNPLDTAFAGEDGTFDLNSFLQFSLPEDTTPPPAEPEPTAEQTQSEEVDDRPQWKKDLDEEREYATTLRQEVLGPYEELAALIDGGRDPIEALREVFAQKEKQLSGYLEEYKREREYKAREASHKETTEKAQREAKLAETTERAQTNLNALVSNMPGKTDGEKGAFFNHIMFSKDIGAPILGREFNKAHPEAKDLPKDQQEKLADEWLIGVQANKADLRYFWERAMDRAARLKMPEASKHSRMQGVKQERETRYAAQKHPAGPYRRQSSPPSGDDAWSTYMGDRV